MSQMWLPFARSTKRGSMPTLLYARTGEFTPPGITLHAAEKNSDEDCVMRSGPFVSKQRGCRRSREGPCVQQATFYRRRVPFCAERRTFPQASCGARLRP